MYRCTECHAEYETKPDYCECSNDVFEEIEPQIQPKKEEIKDTPKVVPEVISEKKTPKNKKKPFWEPSTIILISGCIILSLLILLFVGNTKQENETQQTEAKEEEVSFNIPSIESFWNNTPPQLETQQAPQAPVIQKKTVEKPIVQTQTAQPIKKTQPPEKPKTLKVEKPKQQTKSIDNNKKTTITKQQATSTVSKQTQTTNVAKQQTPVQKPTPLPTTQQQTTVQKLPIPTISQQTQTPTVNKQELLNYKVSLRNTIARKINFANIIGDGTCTITFTISNSGTLENKKFKVQSDNFTLNDVVYAAIMKTPSYNPPPTTYKGETMTFTVKMYNGNFEVSLT